LNCLREGDLRYKVFTGFATAIFVLVAELALENVAFALNPKKAPNDVLFEKNNIIVIVFDMAKVDLHVILSYENVRVGVIPVTKKIYADTFVCNSVSTVLTL
jgi:hypothetical protein